MWAVFLAGVVLGILTIGGLLKLTSRNEPTGCILIFGMLVFLFFVALVLGPQLVFAD